MTLYQRVELAEDVKVQYLGVYALNWNWDSGPPTVGFCEADDTEREFDTILGMLDSAEIMALRAENTRLRGWLLAIVNGPCAESHHRWAAGEALKGEEPFKP